MYDSDGVAGTRELEGRWWNARYGRVARRDVWLYAEPVGWLVPAREGDSEAPVQSWSFACEPDARAWVGRLVDTAGGPSEWRELTSLYRRGDGRPGVVDGCEG